MTHRRWTAAAAASLLGLVGFAVLAGLVLAHPGPLPLDRVLHRLALEHRAPVVGAAAVVSDLGILPVLLPLLLLAGAVAARRTRRWQLLLVGPLLLFAGQAVRWTSMVVVARPRPPARDWARLAAGDSFPSGHTTTSALAWTLMMLLLVPSVSRASRRTLLAVGLLALAALVGVSRVVLGVHWPTDVLGGWSLALFLLPPAASVVRRAARVPAGPAGSADASDPAGPSETVGECPDLTPADPTNSVPSLSPADSRPTRSAPS
jgi:membrane-associated phospholipid phosphatase